MGYNIEFQIAGFIVCAILATVFFSKKRYNSLQNRIYRAVLVLALIELAFDIASVITITNRDKCPRLNTFMSKGYLVAMILWIHSVGLYTLSNTIVQKMNKFRRIEKIVCYFVILAALVYSFIVIFSKELLYGQNGTFVYSYGKPSDAVYFYSTLSVVFVIVVMLSNIKIVPVLKQFSIYSFCVMEGVVAIVQMFNKELLLVGFGSAVAVMIMYFTLENPDMKMIAELDKANKKAQDLLLNILPSTVANRLYIEGSTFTQECNDITIMFMDIVGFTKMSNEVGAVRIVNMLNKFFSKIDELLEGYRIEKIKTIGDAYMVAAGVPEYYEENCDEVLRFAKDVLSLLNTFNKENNMNMNVRIGINIGFVVAGIIGKKKFIYDMWGEAVNLASRMESGGYPGKINVSPAVYRKLKDKYTFIEKDKIEVKGFGQMETYVLEI